MFRSQKQHIKHDFFFKKKTYQVCKLFGLKTIVYSELKLVLKLTCK